jgi:glycosyltransferase involved in cell wall biosynthesis
MIAISVVTPSFNQAAFLEDAIRSVLDQEYPALEYVVADGGSDDGSVAIVQRYAERLTSWWSEPDEGPADAVNRGFALTSGEVMAWLNSDDVLLPGALDVVCEIFEAFPHVEWLTAASHAWIDERGRIVAIGHSAGYHREPFRFGLHGIVQTGRRFDFIQQESTFWRRRLWNAVGGALDVSAEPAADFELWRRFFDRADLYTVETAIGAFRVHSGQRTATALEAYYERARALSRPPGRVPALVHRARGAAPAAIAERLRLGWEVPVIRWDRANGAWREGRRRLR